MRQIRTAFLIAVAFIIIESAPALSAETLTIGRLDTPDRNCIPFSDPFFDGLPGTRYQQAYAASTFSGNNAITITRISFFNDDPYSTLRPGTYSIYLSTISADIDTLSTTDFDDNIGANYALFRTVYLSGSTPDVLSFEGEPFLYNPADGNLLVDIIINSDTPTVPFQNMSCMLAETGADGIFSRYHNFGIGNYGVGLVTQFEFSVAVTKKKDVASPAQNVQRLLESGLLTKGQSNGLMKKLSAADNSMKRGNNKAACNQLDAFINQVSAFIRAGILSQEEGDILIDSVEGIQAQIGS